MQLSPEQKASVAKWNQLGLNVTEAAMRHFIATWFSNIRSLIKADFPLHNIKELADRLGENYQTFTILGSGPSLTEILHSLPDPYGALFCSPTALGAFGRAGVRPTAVIAVDSNPQLYMHLVESDIFRPDTLDIVLPITADPAWYTESVASRDHLFFYLPFLDYAGDTNLALNHAFLSLVPEVQRWWISQAGSVVNTALNFADMCCGDSPDKRIYLGVDCSWIKGKPTRAPLRYPPAAHSKVLREAWELMQGPNPGVAEIPYRHEVIQTDLLSMTYAINMLYIIHMWETPGFAQYAPCKEHRYALIDTASKLYRALSPKVEMPHVSPRKTNRIRDPGRMKGWAYKVMLSLIECSNALRDRLRGELVQKILRDWKENPQVQNVVGIPYEDFAAVVKAVHAQEPSIQFRFDGQEVEVSDAKDKSNLGA